MNRFCFSLALIAWAATASLALADQAADEAAIRKNAEDYVTAYNNHDAKLLASFWSPDAVYLNPQTGAEATGLEAITAEFTDILKDLGDGKLSVEVKSVVFVSPTVAIERGVATVKSPKADPESTDYTAVSVKRDGKWLLDRVSEEAPPVTISNYDNLKDLEWMIGNWANEDEGSRVEMTCKWTKNQAFITRSFSLTVGDQLDMSGIQVIGWDASAKKIRSWVFDSDGGFGEATWTKKDKKWVIDSTATLPDGRKASAINVMKILDDKSFTWQSSGRELDGEILPNIAPIKVARVTESK